VWAGEVTNDTLAPLRAFVRGASAKIRTTGPGHRPRPGALRRTGPPAGAGRWSLVAGLRQPAPAATERAHAVARQLIDRHGVVTREAVLAEGVPGGFVGIYPVFRAMEDAGHVRRGYFVAGLGGAQFAHPGAVERLRAFREPGNEDEDGDGSKGPLVLAAADPAQPYGAALPWPASEGRPARQAGAYVVLADGAPAAYLERGARSLLTFGVEPAAWVDALASLVKDGRLKRIQLGRIDGSDASLHAAVPNLRVAGFVDGYRGLTLRG
jgi:ATP-dependent Lhr-like helicase